MTFFQLTIDAQDPDALARFWEVALGYVRTPTGPADATWRRHYERRLAGAARFTNRLFDPAGAGPPIFFQQVPEGKSGKNRMHLDLYPTGRDDAVPVADRVRLVDARVRELVALGARELRTMREDDPGDPMYVVVLQDAEGNEFCVSG